jgi:hypothetical protein
MTKETKAESKVLTIEDLKQERQRLEFAHQQLVANVNAHLGAIQLIDDLIKKLEGSTTIEGH